MNLEAIERLSATERDLLEGETLDFTSARKSQVFEIATAGREPSDEVIDVSRWQTAELSDAMQGLPEVEIRADVYDYVPSEGDVDDWWVNFADPDLFFGWAGELFAQDELQIAEHPALAALRVRLERTSEVEPRTTGRHRAATPVLVKGVPRRVGVDLAPRRDVGLPFGIYGREFGRASEAAVRAVCTIVDPPTRSNLIAMAAPSPGVGTYGRGTIESVLRTAVTGFGAAVAESDRGVVVHTGYWGCGAFGGNRELMVGLQVVAAVGAGVQKIVIHTVKDDGRADAVAGLEFARAIEVNAGMQEVVEVILGRKLTWGASNGT